MADDSDPTSPLRALVLCCTLSKSPSASSSELLGRRVLEALREHSVTGDLVRVVDLPVAFGVSTDEDGAHHVSAEVYQALSDVGFTIPANGVTYWVGEAMQGTDYQDLAPRAREDRGDHLDARRQHGPPRGAAQGGAVPARLSAARPVSPARARRSTAARRAGPCTPAGSARRPVGTGR